MDFTDDDSEFWDLDPDRTSQIQRVRPHAPERTRTHHVVTRDMTRPVTRDITRSQQVVRVDDDDADMWLDTNTRAGRFGPLSSVDPRLLSIGAVALAAVLAVPLFGALGDEGNGDSQRTVNEQSTTTIPIPATTIAPVAVTAPAETAVSGELESDQPTEAADDPADESSTASQGDPAAQPQGLRAEPECGNQYTASAGDYWLSVADASGSSLDDLLALNAASAETPIYPGDTICLPDGASAGGSGGGSGEAVAAMTPDQTAQCANVYTVAGGDYWLGIATATGVELDELLATNGANADTQLFPGSEVCLPAEATVPTAPTSSEVVTTASTTAAESTALATTAPSTTGAQTTAPSTTESEPTDPPAPPPPPAEIEQMIRDVWPDDLEDQALRIAWRESNYRPGVTSPTGCCHGIFQINWDAHRGWLEDMGVTSRDQLFDASINVDAAYALYQRNGWGPWAQTAD